MLWIQWITVCQKVPESDFHNEFEMPPLKEFHNPTDVIRNFKVGAPSTTFQACKRAGQYVCRSKMSDFYSSFTLKMSHFVPYSRIITL